MPATPKKRTTSKKAPATAKKAPATKATKATTKKAAPAKGTKAKAKATKADEAPKANRQQQLDDAVKAVLAVLAKGRATRTELKQQVEYSNWTKLTKVLEERGLANEVKHEDDKYRHLEITAAGRKAK